MPSNTMRLTRGNSITVWKSENCPGCSSLGRSTARRVMKKRRPRGWERASVRRREVKIESLLPWIETVLGETPERGVLMTVETEVKYKGYIDQQRRQMEHMQGSDARAIPLNLEFGRIPGISREVGERLER